MVNDRLRKYQIHNDELEKEIEMLSKQRLEWEKEFNELQRDRDSYRK